MICASIYVYSYVYIYIVFLDVCNFPKPNLNWALESEPVCMQASDTDKLARVRRKAGSASCIGLSF